MALMNHEQMDSNVEKYYVIGVDVGGTNTDAVIYEQMQGRIVSEAKTPTTDDFFTGVVLAIRKVIAEQKEIEESDVCAVMIGTTLFLNAILQCSKELARVVCIRLCGKLTQSIPPLSTFPKNLAERLKDRIYYVNGGFEYDNTTVDELDEAMLERIGEELSKRADDECVNIAVTGVFSSLYSEQESRARELLENAFRKGNLDRFSITTSHKLGQIGLLERENSTILNASLRPMALKALGELEDLIQDLNLVNCVDRIFLTQNDGTLITLEEAIMYPILTFNSGPVNSLRGASVLSGLKDAIVMDIGGTTTDLAVLVKGFPRTASSVVNIAGIRTNFRMPDTLSIALGGGSVITGLEDSSRLKIGPKSVGHSLLAAAVSFGGGVLTLSDVAVATGIASFYGSDPALVTATKEQLEVCEKEAVRMLSAVIDRIKTTKEPVPLVMVGGGSVLIREGVLLPGISEVIKPPHGAVANALGAATAMLASSLERVIDLTGKTQIERSMIDDEIKSEARRLLVEKGAKHDNIEIVIDKIHMSYCPGEVTRIVTKAIGNIDFKAFCKPITPRISIPGFAANYQSVPKHSSTRVLNTTPFVDEAVLLAQTGENLFNDMVLRDPLVVSRDGRMEWIITADDIDCMAIGAGIMGCGGGGSPYLGKLEAKRMLAMGKTIRVITVGGMREDTYSMGCALYGAPLTHIERLASCERCVTAMRAIAGEMNLDDWKYIDSVNSFEIGGLNSMAPLTVGAMMDLPVVDCDLMGRALPQYQMITPLIYGENPLPCCLAGDYGSVYMLTEKDVPDRSSKACEQLLRDQAGRFGCDAAIGGPVNSKAMLQRLAIMNSYSRIYRIGRRIIEARISKCSPFESLEKFENARLIFTGKITDVIRLTQGGFNKGVVEVMGSDCHANGTLHVEFMNENLVASVRTPECDDKILATVPDLISILDAETFEPITTEEVRYGLRVAVITMPCHPLLTTEVALSFVGPSAFGYSHPYVRCAPYVEPSSVLDE